MKPPKALVLLAVLCTSASSIFIRFTNMPPLVIACLRMVFSAVFLLLPVLIKERGLKHIAKRDLVLCLLSGLALALHFGTWITSLSMTSVMASTVLVSASPIFVAILGAALYKQKPGKVLLGCLGAAITGTVIISIGSGSESETTSFAGNMLALSGALFVAVYLMIGQDVRKRLSTTAYAFTVYSAAAVFLFIGCLATSQPLGPYEPREYLLTALMAAVCSIGGHTLYNMLLKYHGAALISIATLGEPVFASLLAAAFLRETPGLLTVVGGVVILASLTTYIVKMRKD